MLNTTADVIATYPRLAIQSKRITRLLKSMPLEHREHYFASMALDQRARDEQANEAMNAFHELIALEE